MQQDLFQNSVSATQEQPEQRADVIPFEGMRPYQNNALVGIDQTLYGQRKRSALVIMPTGTGKTVVFAELARRRAQDRVLAIAHRETLITQARRKLQDVVGEYIGEERAENEWSGERCVVGSVQSLHPKRLAKFPRDAFSLIIVDEAHHASSASYVNVFNHFEQAKLVGFTATPDRADNKNIGAVFEKIAFVYPLTDAIRDGYLVPIVGVKCQERIDLEGLSLAKGDFSEKELEEIIEKSIGPIAKGIVEKNGGRKTIAFTPRIRSATLLAQAINELGVTAEAISSEQDQPTRDRILNDFRNGSIQVLCNCGIFTEGFDEPSIECVALARPTLSRSLFAQMVGRGTRLYPGKQNMLLLEFTWNSGKHKLVTAFELFAADGINERTRDAAAKRALGKEEIDFFAELELEKSVVKRSVERVRLRGEGRYSVFDPMGFCDMEGIDLAGEMDFSDFETARREHGIQDPERFAEVWGVPITDKQLNFLGYCGFDKEALKALTKWGASRLIGNINKRADGGKPWGVVGKWYNQKTREARA